MQGLAKCTELSEDMTGIRRAVARHLRAGVIVIVMQGEMLLCLKMLMGHC